MDFMGQGGEIGGMQFPLEQWYFEMPLVTRVYMTAIAVTSVLVQCRVLSPYSLFYGVRAVFKKGQVRVSSLYQRPY
jgi:Derlin-2/3